MPSVADVKAHIDAAASTGMRGQALLAQGNAELTESEAQLRYVQGTASVEIGLAQMSQAIEAVNDAMRLVGVAVETATSYGSFQ